MTGKVLAVSARRGHHFSKTNALEIRLIAGLGVDGDAHAGVTVKHRSRVAKDPSQPNLRQVHLIAQEWLDELAGHGFDIKPGDLGENITTTGIDLIHLPLHSVLQFGRQAQVRVTGLRNPCGQLDRFQQGLKAAALGQDEKGGLILKAGIMAVVIASGLVQTGDEIDLTLPEKPHLPLERV